MSGNTKKKIDSTIKEEDLKNKISIIDWMLATKDVLAYTLISLIVFSSFSFVFAIATTFFFDSILLSIISVIISIIPFSLIMIIVFNKRKLTRTIFEYRILNESVKIGSQFYSRWYLKYHPNLIKFDPNDFATKVTNTSDFIITKENYDKIVKYDAESDLKEYFFNKLRKKYEDVFVKDFQPYDFNLDQSNGLTNFNFTLKFKVQFMYRSVPSRKFCIDRILADARRFSDVKREKRNHWKNLLVTNSILSFKSFLKLKKLEKKNDELNDENDKVKEFTDYHKNKKDYIEWG